MVSLRRRLPALLHNKPAAPEPDAPSTTPDEESLLPRWLRPSVRAARVASPKPPAPKERRAPLLFAAPVDGATERLVIRYDRVQLLDRPDDALGMPVGELDTGDEIDVLERDAIWVRVRTPADRDGWVPAMTLAPPDALPPEPAPEAAAEQSAGSVVEPDQPALEELLAIAAERRALADAQPPVVAEEPPKPAAQAVRAPRKKQPNPAHRTRKPARHTSTRKKRH
ncbi:MAG TPA: SH3 domain-containing protein [Candidatus Limnocylindrales bacterium]|jgi:hypothetical protein|nr:SH3 domain-containing protein [Candidatus Limnocylindrales bacterium]